MKCVVCLTDENELSIHLCLNQINSLSKQNINFFREFYDLMYRDNVVVRLILNNDLYKLFMHLLEVNSILNILWCGAGANTIKQFVTLKSRENFQDSYKIQKPSDKRYFLHFINQISQ